MTFDDVETILGPGEEIPREQVSEVARERKHLDGSSSNKVVEGDRFFKWPNDDEPGLGYYVSFRNSKVLEKHNSFMQSF